MKFSRASRRCDGIADEFGAIWWGKEGSGRGAVIGVRGGTVQGGGRITKGTKVREHERGGLQRGWHRGGDLAVAGTAATLRVPETRAEQLFVVRRRGAGRRPAVAGTAETVRVPDTRAEQGVVRCRGTGSGVRAERRSPTIA